MLEAFRYRPLGILRFVLALMVLVQHFDSDIASDAIKRIIFPYAPGNIAVLCFFILSGFIICEAYHYNYHDRPFAYLKNRFVRIFPGYWAALLISILIHWMLLQHYSHLRSPDHHEISSRHFMLHNLIRNFLFIIPPVRLNFSAINYSFIPYAWALQTEMMFYLTLFIIGVSYQYLKRYISWPQGYWLSFAAFLGIAAGSAVQMHLLPRQLAFGSYFAFGGSMFFYLSGKRGALFVLIPAFIQMLWHFYSYDTEDFAIISANRPGQLALFIIILMLIVLLATIKIRSEKIDKWAGNFSYPLYLNHYVVIVVIVNIASQFTTSDLWCGLISSLFLSCFIFWVVDKPLIKVRRAIRQEDSLPSDHLASADP
jgi:peptidoglycan/LPS O-acetylase OafA/YrhL